MTRPVRHDVPADRRATDATASRGPASRIRLAVVIVHFRTYDVTLRCLQALEPEIAGLSGARVVIVDNASGDGSDERLEAEIRRRGWDPWAVLVRSPRNGGFSAGNNVGLGHVESEYYLLLNSDAFVEPRAIQELLRAMEERPDAGLVGPRLLLPDGSLHHSCYRFLRPLSELPRAAGTGPLSRILYRWGTTLSHPEEPSEPEWTSFACVLLRGEAFRSAGFLDEGYFMYFEDQDYCRTLRRRGWKIVNWPRARVVHLGGSSGPVRALSRARLRRPRYYYASRTRYYAKHFGPAGYWLANLMWMAGRLVSFLREVFGSKRPHACSREGVDIWINWRNPLGASER